MHLGFGAASAVIAAPSSPARPAEAFRCAQSFVSCNRSGGVGLPELGVLPWRDDRCGPSGGYGVVAFAPVEGAVRCPATVCVQTVRGGCDAADLLSERDLVEQLGQHGGVAHVAGGELRCPDFQCLLVNSNVDLAPDPPLGAAMLAPSSGQQSPGLLADPPPSTRLRRRP